MEYLFASSGAAAGTMLVSGLSGAEAADGIDFSASGLVTGKPKPLRHKSIPGFLSAEQIAPHHSAHYGGALRGYSEIDAKLDQSIRDRRRLGIFFTAGTWFEILIFSYFGLLALTQTVRLYGVAVDGVIVFIATGLVVLAIFVPLHKKVRANQISRAEQAFTVL